MKKVLLVALVTGFSSMAQASNDYAGIRIGAGATTGMKVDGLGTLKAQPKIEFGYDFNRIFSVNGSLMRFDGEHNQISSKALYGGKADGYDARIEGEIGYAFNIADGWDLKPYAALGGAHVSGSIESHNVGLLVALPSGTQNNIDSYSGNFSGNYLTTAAGLRLTTPVGIYADARVQSLYMTANQEVRTPVKENAQFGFTVGFKF
ncbi:outer membrane beta-barrel protein [Vibrio barjaei]|uniref:Outer membrane beta-barrel protein n=1 Tax=Vibrio barjaei TaxID=1676683 RepID=A0ABW7IMY3_9VIBR|nr:outer membrane beta-barrel protein [Vibrio barjaei]MCG9788144.1 porin family protein [Vibrio mediterranei]MCY9872593.1 outer membrane beta-barrel protein [Vibrio barjaei]